MKIQIEKEFTNEQIAGLLCSALEGGSNYWYMHTETKDDFEEDGLNPDEWASIYRAPLSSNGWIKIQDMEDDNCEYLLNRTIIEEGLKLMASNYANHFHDFVIENYDAITGDVFLQCCLLRDVVYG